MASTFHSSFMRFSWNLEQKQDFGISTNENECNTQVGVSIQ